jgi:hypothetical protein
MKNVVFWNVTSCSSCKNWGLERTYRLHHQDDMNRRAKNKIRSNFKVCFGCKSLLTLSLARRFLLSWWCRLYIPPKRQFLQEGRRDGKPATYRLSLRRVLCILYYRRTGHILVSAPMRQAIAPINLRNSPDVQRRPDPATRMRDYETICQCFRSQGDRGMTIADCNKTYCNCDKSECTYCFIEILRSKLGSVSYL